MTLMELVVGEGIKLVVGEGITYIKQNWTAQATVDQRRRRLAELVLKLQTVVDTAETFTDAAMWESSSEWVESLRSEVLRGQSILDDAPRDTAVNTSVVGRFLANFKRLFFSNPEVGHLEAAVEQLERIAGPDLDMFVKMLAVPTDRAAVTDMEVDGAQEESASSSEFEGTVASLPSRKRKCTYDGGVDGSCTDDGASTSRCEVDVVQAQKRRGGCGFGAPREPSALLLPSRKRAHGGGVDGSGVNDGGGMDGSSVNDGGGMDGSSVNDGGGVDGSSVDDGGSVDGSSVDAVRPHKRQRSLAHPGLYRSFSLPSR